MSSTDLFVPIKFNTSVQLKPSELGPNIEEILYAKLKSNLENMCSKHGYIKKNSIKIIKRSMGHIKIPHFNGNVAFELSCIAEICNPAQGSIIKCKVKAKNSLGLLAEGFYDNDAILQIIVPKISAGIQSEINIDKVNVGEEINIEVCGKKFLLYDKHISIIGKAIKDRGQQNVVVDAPVEVEEDNKPAEDIENEIYIFDDKKSEIAETNDDDNDEELEDELDENDEEEEVDEEFENFEDADFEEGDFGENDIGDFEDDI